MPTARVGSVKAADPGLGFTLNFEQALNNSLKVAITMTDLQTKQTYKSEVTLFDPISDQELVFVVPFGDNAYAPSNCLGFQIDLYWPYDTSSSTPNETLTGVVMGEKGVFNFSTSVPTEMLSLPKTGDMLQSEDGRFIGIYQKDGNFCVYPQFASGQRQSLNPTFTSNSDINQATFFQLYSLSGRGEGQAAINVFKADGTQIVSTSLPFNYSSGGSISMTISNYGALCFNNLQIGFTKG